VEGGEGAGPCPRGRRGAAIYLHLIREQARLRAEFYNTVAAGVLLGGIIVPVLQSGPSPDLAAFARWVGAIAGASFFAWIFRKLATIALNEFAHYELLELNDTMAGRVSARTRPTEIPAGIAETARSLDRLGAEMDRLGAEEGRLRAEADRLGADVDENRKERRKLEEVLQGLQEMKGELDQIRREAEARRQQGRLRRAWDGWWGR
jgi:hypothetical protein